jgi:hypothetical protein
MVASDVEVVTRGAELRPRLAEGGVRTARHAARLVDVGLRVLHGVLRLRLLVAEVLDVGVGEWGRRTAYAQSDRRGGDNQALACGDGEESHR